MDDGGGLCSLPLYTGQSPLRIRNNDDFPQPLGPDISKCIPGSIWDKQTYYKTKR